MGMKVVASGPVAETPPVEAQPMQIETAQPQAQTAQTRGNEPFSQNSEPFDSTHDKPLVRPEESFNYAQDKTPPHGEESPRAHDAREDAKKGNFRKQEQRREKIAKLMAEIEKRGRVTNDEVEKLLHVSDATATRYLSLLEKEGKIKQVGKTGVAVVYEKI